MLNCCSLYSRSSGNSLFVETDNTKLLIDAGVSSKKIEKALNDLEDWCNRYDKNYGCSFGSIKYLMDNAKPVS